MVCGVYILGVLFAVWLVVVGGFVRCVFVGCCGLAFACLLDAWACGLVVGPVVLRLCVYVACIVLV